MDIYIYTKKQWTFIYYDCFPIYLYVYRCIYIYIGLYRCIYIYIYMLKQCCAHAGIYTSSKRALAWYTCN